MTQMHYGDQGPTQVSDILLSLYEAVFSPEKFLVFLNLLESALTDQGPEQILTALERPSANILKTLATEELATVKQKSPWVTAADVSKLQTEIVATGFEPFPDDIRALSDLPENAACVVRIFSESAQTDWAIVVRNVAALEAFRMPQNWELFLRGQFRRQFRLTSAELEVLLSFLAGTSLRDIAGNRCSSYNTVRNQIRSIMEKLSVSSQTELASVVTRVAALSPTQSMPQVDEKETKNLVTRKRKLPDGRIQEYNVYNTAGTKSLVLFHCLAGGKHLSDETVDWAARQGFRVICPSRAGFAGSDSCNVQGVELLQTHVLDTADLLRAYDVHGPVTALCFGTGFTTALSFAIAYPQRCRRLITINPVPPLSAIGDANNLKGSFKVGYLTAKYAPLSFKALPYLHARMHRATRKTRTSPTVLPEYDLKVLETPSGYAAFKQNADDALSNGPDAIWSEARLCLSDWLPQQHRQNSLPQIVWVETGDSPFTRNGAFEEFRKSIRAKIVRVERTFPLFATQLPYAFEAFDFG